MNPGATRREWARIWREEADVARELATLDYPRARQAKTLYLPFLPRDGLILEAGCGLGIEVIDLGRLGYRLIGVDYVEGAVSETARHTRHRRLAVADVHALPFRAGGFGAYLSFGVLEHFEGGPAAALREAHRVLRDGGILVATVPYPNLVRRAVDFKRRLTRATPADFYETTYDVDTLVKYVGDAGFEVLERHPIGHSFTWWTLGPVFRRSGYYETSTLAETLGRASARLWPWTMCFASLVIARKRARTLERS